MAFKHQESRRALLHIFYEAARTAAATHNPYADPATIASVGEALAEKIETFLTGKGDHLVEFEVDDADTYDYICAILDEVHKTIPITQYFNVKLFMQRLERISDATPTPDRGKGRNA